MKRSLTTCGVILLFCFTTRLASAQKGDRARLAGAWRLQALEQPGAEGKVNRIRCCGMFVFTADGHLSVQVMEPGAESSPTASTQYSQGGYEASYGSYVVDEKSHTFSFHVEGALVRSLIGKDLRRRYSFDGDRLIVQSADPDEHWRVIWVRY